MKTTAAILGIVGGFCGLPYIYGFFLGLSRALESTNLRWDYWDYGGTICLQDVVLTLC